ncbi:MAG TPA: heavy metal translocating P-type ATPase, partial [Thiobacillus sp.]|nr:heavy metal translocating P-type ATPase [Thiobacillus sp.]
MVADFRRRFWISLALTIPILALSSGLWEMLGLAAPVAFRGDAYVLFGFSSIVFFYGGWPFLKGFGDELRQRQPGMMTLI